MRLMPSNNRGPKRQRRWLERLALLLLLLLAWSWIMVTFGMVFYHGYYKKKNRSPPASPDATASAPRNRPNEMNDQPSSTSPLLIITCNRDEYLKETLNDVLRYIPRDCSIGCPIVVSQDGNNPKVQAVAKDFRTRFAQIGIELVHIEHKSALRGSTNAYQALAVHYGWALEQVFGPNLLKRRAERVIILEEDLHIAEDFFSYFDAMAPLLDQDRSLLAVSAFNDNGYEGQIADPTRVLRSDFFPGLGWLMTRKLWDNELKIKWPSGYWDDWLREPAQRQSRHILRPEVSRTFHFGFLGGASGNQFGEKLQRVKLDATPVDWKRQDLFILREDNFDRSYWNLIHSARRVTSIEEALEQSRSADVYIEYDTLHRMQSMLGRLRLMDDEKRA